MSRPKHPYFDRYVEACNYPGALDEEAVTTHLGEYLAALGVTRHVVRLRRGWKLDEHPPMARAIDAIAADIARRAPQAALAAQAAQDAQDARAALAARAAQDAQAAQAAQDAQDARAALAARAAQDAQAALDAQDAQQRLAAWCIQARGWWSWWELSWIVITLFGAKRASAEERWSRPLMHAYLSGCWLLYWTDSTLYWAAKPRVHVERSATRRALHRLDGPALESDVEDLYFVDGVLVPARVVMDPASMSAAEIKAEPNAEVRRVMRQQYGQGKYLREIGAKLIDADFESAKVGAAPRALLEDDEGRRYLVGTDGSTSRVYYMEVPSASTTCRQAHVALCGFDERKIVSKS